MSTSPVPPPPPGQAMGWMCRCAPPRMFIHSPPSPTSLAAARPPSLLPPPFHAGADPPLNLCADEIKGGTLFISSARQAAPFQGPFTTRLQGRLEVMPRPPWPSHLPTPLSVLCVYSPPPLGFSMRDRHSMAFTPPSSTYVNADFSRLEDGKSAGWMDPPCPPPWRKAVVTGSLTLPLSPACTVHVHCTQHAHTGCGAGRGPF